MCIRAAHAKGAGAGQCRRTLLQGWAGLPGHVSKDALLLPVPKGGCNVWIEATAVQNCRGKPLLHRFSCHNDPGDTGSAFGVAVAGLHRSKRERRSLAATAGAQGLAQSTNLNRVAQGSPCTHAQPTMRHTSETDRTEHQFSQRTSSVDSSKGNLSCRERAGS